MQVHFYKLTVTKYPVAVDVFVGLLFYICLLLEKYQLFTQNAGSKMSDF